MFGCLVAGRLVSAARAAGGALNPLGAGAELRQGRPAGFAPFPRRVPPGAGRGQRPRHAGPAPRRAPASHPQRQLRCGAPSPEAVTVPSVNGEAGASQGASWELKRSFLRLDCALAAGVWHLG